MSALAFASYLVVELKAVWCLWVTEYCSRVFLLLLLTCRRGRVTVIYVSGGGGGGGAVLLSTV